MIVEQCRKLHALLVRLQQAELDLKRAATLEPVRKELTHRYTLLKDAGVHAAVLAEARVLRALSVPPMKPLTTALANVRANLAADPFAVTKGKDYRAVEKHLDALHDQLRDQLVREWGAWVDRETARIDDAELSRYAAIREFGETV